MWRNLGRNVIVHTVCPDRSVSHCTSHYIRRKYTHFDRSFTNTHTHSINTNRSWFRATQNRNTRRATRPPHATTVQIATQSCIIACAASRSGLVVCVYILCFLYGCPFLWFCAARSTFLPALPALVSRVLFPYYESSAVLSWTLCLRTVLNSYKYSTCRMLEALFAKRFKFNRLQRWFKRVLQRTF